MNNFTAMTTAMLKCGVIAVAVLGLVGSSRGESPTPPRFPWFDPSLPTSERAQALVKAIPAESRVSQLVTDAPGLPDQGIPAYMWRSNVLHGLVDNGVSTQFPQATGLAATWDAVLLNSVGEICSTEQRAKHNIATNFSATAATPMNYGVDLWGPNINMFRDPRWGRGQETYGEDPVLSGALGSAFINGLQYGPVPNVLKTIATAKHFDAYSVDREPPRLSFDPNISEADLHQYAFHGAPRQVYSITDGLDRYYFPAFVSVVRAGVRSIMCSYNGIDGHPMCESPMLKTVLRDEMNFEGYIVSDSGAVDFMVSFFHRYNTTTEASAAALNAGVDLNSGSAYLKLTDALSKNLVSQEQIDTALVRLFEARIDAGLLDPPSNVVPYTTYSQQDILSPSHRAVALRAAEESIVLLKNDVVGGAPVLPLGVELDGIKIAVVGPASNDSFRMLGNYYGCSFGTWGPVLDNCSVSTFLDGVTKVASAAGASVNFSPGCDQESTDTSKIAAAVELAKASDVVIAFLGLRNCEGGQGKGGANCESEGHDRDELGLPGVQQQLLKQLHSTGKKIVLVLSNGGPVAIPWAAQNIAAIVDAWYGGMDGGIGLANVLFGVDGASPAGRLPFSVPTSVAQVPDELDMSLVAPPHGRTYRHFNATPLFNFGFGLSYTRFEYSNMSLSAPSISASAPTNLTVCVLVSNVGSKASDEVVQIYASRSKTDNIGLQSVPNVQLVSFVRISAVPSGASENVCIFVDTSTLSLLGADGTFGPQPGTYAIYVGGSCPGPLGAFVSRSAVQEPLTAPFSITH